MLTPTQQTDPALASSGALDPSDWGAFDQAVDKVLSAVSTKMRQASKGRVWTPMPGDLKDALNAPPPMTGLDHDAVAARLIALLPYGVGNTHPRFFGWVHGAGAPGNLLADMIASAINANCGGRDHVGIYVERQVIDWCRTLMRFPDTASGLIVSGTSMASLIAAKTARDAALSFANRQAGLGTQRLIGYVSSEAHNCLARAFDLLGLGTDALRKVAVTEAFEIDLDDLQAQIARDREAGHQPFMLAGNAGTVNTGAIDDLAALADIASREGLWFHVDGAFGACGMLHPELAPKLSGLERASSLAFDFHKWLHVNYDAGCVLIRDGALHRQAFASRPDYLAAGGMALAGGDPWPVDFGPELSRGFRALKVWSHLLEHGTPRLGETIADNCAQAAYLSDLVEAHPRFERLAPTSLNICCFRYRPHGVAIEELDALNAALVARIQLSGVAAPSTTRSKGALSIRVNITNHRTKLRDMELLVKTLAERGDELVAEARPNTA